MVLCTGWDQSLLDTRALILKSAGHEVRQARTQNEVVSECEQHQFDVVVIGQTVSVRMKRVIVAIVKQHCHDAKILELYQPHWGEQSPMLTHGWRSLPRFRAIWQSELVSLQERNGRADTSLTPREVYGDTEAD